MTWAWAANQYDEAWTGFETREEALAEGPGWIAPASYPSPGEFVARGIGVGDVLERMNELVNDAGFYTGDDEVFAAPADMAASSKAADELADLLHQWADKHLKANYFTVDIEHAEPVSEARALAEDE